MRTQLFSRNVWIGVLMAFVLAFGVQDTADAISRLTRSAGDLQTVTAGRDYQIRFSVTLQSPVKRVDHANHIRTPSASVTDTLVADKRNKTTYYLDDYDGTDPATRGYQSETQVTYDAVYDYDQESIGITVSGGSLKKVGSHDASGTTLTMYESTHNMYSSTSNPHQRLSGSVTLTLTAPTTAAPVTITITDNSADGDFTTVPVPRASTEFTVYVVGPLNSGGSTVVNSTDTDGVERVSDQADTRIDGDFTQAANEPVYYTVEGSGRLYVSPAAAGAIAPVSDRKTSPTNNLYTSSSAPVFLDTNGGSSKVTAYIAGSGVTAKVLYIFSGGRLSELPQITVQSINNQTGAPEGRLEDYFEVKVTDGRRRPVSGVPVTFSATDPTTPAAADPASIFIPVPGTKIYDPAPTTTAIDAGSPITTEAEAVSTFPSDNVSTTADPASVQTDRNGVAKIYYQLSSNSGLHRVTATVHGDSAIFTTLTATASSTARARIANLEIVSGNNQSAEKGKDLTDPLVVIVRSLAGHRIQDVIVQFRTTTGILVPAPGTDQPTDSDLGLTSPSSLNPPSGQQIYVKTGPNGEAGVTYNIGQLVESRNIIAEVRREVQTATQYDFAIREVVFNVNGGSTGRSSGDDTDDPAPAPATITRTLDIDVSGTGTTRTVTVTALENGSSRRDIFVDLRVTGSGASLSRTSGGTPLESTLTLPAGAGEYTLRASTTDYTTATETITVTVPGTLTVSTISPTTGAQTVSVTARRNGSLQSGVNFTISGSGIVPARGVTTAAGSGNAILNFPNIGTYALTVRAEGYTDLPVSVTISTVGQPTPTTTTTPTTTPTGTAGEADSIEIDGSRSISGTVNQATRLRVRVLDANDRGVSGVRVTFRVLAPGRGRLSQRGNGRAVQAVTDRSGYATASLTPLGGNLIVEAKAARVSAPVSFIINIDGSAGDTSASTTRDTTSPQTYNVRDEIPISLEGTLTFRGSRTLNGITYTCVGSGECVVSFGTVVKGQIQAAPEKTTASQTYKVRDEIPISLEDTLSFTGKHTVNGTIYTCVGPGECVVSFGTVVKGEIRVSAVSTTPPTRTATEINPEVLIGAGQRPPMIWVDSGKIYALVGKDVQEFASGVEGAMNIAVGGGKVYWTERTGESSGTINAANLDGSDVKELASIQAIPMGIAVDPPGSKLYWTNSRGRIQSANLNGSGIQNVIQNLPSPMDITLARGILYWTQYDATESAGSIGIANPTGRGTPKHISTGANMPGSLVIGGGKVYWTQQTGESSGTIHSANLSGNGVNELASIRAVPMGIAVDTARSKLYWTNSRGRIQSAALNGSKIQNVVDGLGMPGDMVLSNSLKAPTAATPTEKVSTSTASTSKYDVNGDGTVDSKDSDALIVAVAAGITDTKYDVNGDGKVDVNDIVAVTNNRNGGAPGAPTLLGMKLSALEVDRLQEQIDLLIATNDRSPAAMRTLVYLQQLIVMARPEQTQLLANYPNPFNPETWIPYQLATDTDVRLTIYNAQGAVVRVLELGQQSAGYYTDRERAAYWDGRNALGEQVASGIYFYQLETDDMSSLRKMVILK